MILNILNSDRELIDVIRTYESVLWTKKYQDVGGCVLMLTPTNELVDMFLNDAKYISRDDDSMVCEIKKIGLSMDNLTHKYTLTVTGLGCETLLRQRIVWNQTNITDTAEIYIRRLILDNVMAEGDRQIDFVVLGQLKGFTEQITKQVTYEELLPTIIDICKSYNLGFRFVKLSNDNLAFEVYRGKITDIMFSKQFNNLLSFNYEMDLSEYKNVCLVGGEGEGTARKTKEVGTATGIDRYETFADANSQSSEEGTISNYEDILNESGVEDLANKTVKETFSCQIDVEQYDYKIDYDLGDMVTIEGEYGITIQAQIIEIVECKDQGGYRITANLKI